MALALDFVLARCWRCLGISMMASDVLPHNDILAVTRRGEAKQNGAGRGGTSPSEARPGKARGGKAKQSKANRSMAR